MVGLNFLSHNNECDDLQNPPAMYIIPDKQKIEQMRHKMSELRKPEIIILEII